jgi:hypothetical protein
MKQIAFHRMELRLRARAFGDADEAFRHVQSDDLGA